MSWISDLAGRAENILNKLDQNAANVLQQPNRPESTKSETEEPRIDPISTETIRRNLSSNSLSLSRSLTPKRSARNELNVPMKIENGEGSVKSDKLSGGGSNISSRRSSIGSRTDGTVIEQEMTSSTHSNSKTSNQDLSLERELAAMKIILAEVTAERNELQGDLDVLQAQIKQSGAENRIRELEQLVDALAVERDEVTKERDQIKSSVDEYIKSISELETNLSKVRQSIIELTEKSDWQTKEISQKSIELQEYRKKAQATLQMKEKIIEELKAKGSSTDQNLDNNNEKILNMEINGLRQENQHLRDEMKNLHDQIESSKALIENLEQQLNDKTAEISSIHNANREKLTIEQRRAQQFESENLILNQELNAVRDEMNRQQKSFSARLHEKTNELMKLRSQMSESPTLLSDNGNFENRMQSLTQALVKKQAALETVTAERNAMRLQLEKVEDQLRHLMVEQRQQRSQIINVNDTDDVKAQMPLLMQENPFDTNVTRRVKRAYTSLDSAGIRLGVFLRRYPLVRIMVFIYIAFLHLWVMFVLLSSTPS